MFGKGFTGEVVELAAIGLGAAISDFIDQKFLNPLAVKFLPAAGLFGTMVDAGTTWVSAVVLGKGVGMISKRFGDPLELGGKIAAVAKGVSALVPGYSFGATLPIFTSNNAHLLMAGSAGAAAGTAAGSQATLGPAVGGSPAAGYPSPAVQGASSASTFSSAEDSGL